MGGADMERTKGAGAGFRKATMVAPATGAMAMLSSATRPACRPRRVSSSLDMPFWKVAGVRLER